MTTLKARKKTHELITASEFLKRRAQDPKSVEGAKIISPRLGENSFGRFAIKRAVPQYEVF